MTPRFGAQRLRRGGLAAQYLFRLMGVADPAHYLHFRYLERALAALPAPPRRILDAGCGAGDHSIYLAQRFPSAHVTGVDVDRDRIAQNRGAAADLGLTNLDFQVQDIGQLPWVQEFDLVISIDVLEHIVEQRAALRSLHSALRSGGRFFIHIPTVRHRPVPFSRWLKGFHEWAEKEHVAKDVTAEEFIDALKSVGFTVDSFRRTFGFYTGELATSLFALPYAPRLHNKIIQAALAPACRVLVLADSLGLERDRYALAVTGNRV